MYGFDFEFSIILAIGFFVFFVVTGIVGFIREVIR